MEGTRPWIKGDKHPLKEKFLYYKNKSPWMDMEDWPDKRSGKDKVLKILFNITPKLLLCSVVGFVHGTFVPWNNQRILNKTR